MEGGRLRVEGGREVERGGGRLREEGGRLRVGKQRTNTHPENCLSITLASLTFLISKLPQRVATWGVEEKHPILAPPTDHTPYPLLAEVE